MAWNEPGNNNRDPWNQGPGGKGGNVPPDPLELLRRLQARWGGRGGKGMAGVPAALVAALLLLIWLLLGFYTVDEQDRAVVVRMGAYARTDGPGLHWHLPPPFEHVKKINVGNPRQTSLQSELFTKDQNLVDVGLTLQFRITAAEDYLFNVESPDDTLRAATESALQKVVSAYTVDEVLGDSKSAIANKTRALVQQTLDGYHCGLAVTDVSFNNKVQPPDEVQAAFFDAIRAVQDQASARNDAEAYAGSRLPSARAEAARSITEATAYRDQVIARAEGDAARFDAVLQEYRKSPQVTRKRLYLDTMSEIYAGNGKVLIDVDKASPSFTVPLQQLLPPSASAGAPAAPPQPAAGTGNANSAEDNARRGREDR